jgi:hypothetical protein
MSFMSNELSSFLWLKNESEGEGIAVMGACPMILMGIFCHLYPIYGYSQLVCT